MGGLKGFKILVIDDDSLTREAIGCFLKVEGCIVDYADNGGTGMAKLGDFKPDLVILDLMMPVVNGWEFLSAKAIYEEGKDVPVVIVSGYLMVPHEIVGSHIVKTISKPAEPEEIVRVVREVLNRQLPLV